MTIDITDWFHTEEYMQGGPNAWTVDRTLVPFKNIIIHHSTESYDRPGWAYGVPVEGTTEGEEQIAIAAMARDHYNRFGIGPGYNYVVFQSGRIYAVGKAGTIRWHTSNTGGRTDGNTWNYDSVAICWVGDSARRTVSMAAQNAIAGEIEAIRGWEISDIQRAMGHKDANPRTSCPGDNLYSLVKFLAGESAGGYQQGFEDGWDEGYMKAIGDMRGLLDTLP